MKELQDIANLIAIRNFLDLSVDNLHIKLSRDDIRSVQTKVQLLDKTIVEQSLKLDLSKITRETHNVIREFSITSTEDTETVLKKFSTVSQNPDVEKIKSESLETK
jgi:hypothetical protein